MRECIQSATGTDRLALLFIETAVEGSGGIQANFYELVWLHLEEGSLWEARTTITRKMVQNGSSSSRWIIGLNSFDQEEATAIVKLGESIIFKTEYEVEYTWQKLNLESLEFVLIRKCITPFEEY